MYTEILNLFFLLLLIICKQNKHHSHLAFVAKIQCVEYLFKTFPYPLLSHWYTKAHMTFLRGIMLDNVNNVRELISLEITLFLLTTPVASLIYIYI